MTINTKCLKHKIDRCMVCNLSVSAAEHEKLTFPPNITLSPFDQIGKVDWQCQHHGSTRFMWACVECVKEQLAKEYERGKKEAVKCTIVEREALEAAYNTYINCDAKWWSKYLEAFARLRNERLEKQ